MTTPRHLLECLKARLSSSRASRRGVALVMVLTVVSLCTVLMMTFLAMSMTERSSSVHYSDGLQAQEIAESAVNVVIAQIREATSSRNRVWASQPGCIRTWDDQGKFHKAWKLYSDEQMTEIREEALVSYDYDDLKEWQRAPWTYVDLNEPVIRGKSVYYPIVNPIARDEPKWPSAERRLPNEDKAGIEGFDWNEDKVGLSEFDLMVRRQLQKPTLPMPVKWIYQLRDGTLGTVDKEKRFVPAHPEQSSPSKDNPIVGRFAFWADDETCKLNPNVHAGGSSWMTPLTGGDIDRNFAGAQPVNHEWQRYPGHPATTFLSPVFLPGMQDITNERRAIEVLYSIVPRVVGGGSEVGTRTLSKTDFQHQKGLTADIDRLYATNDEVLLKEDRTPNTFPEAGGLLRQKSLTAGAAVDLLEKSRFFLTTVSRAPEVNLFNQPRITIWPSYFVESASDAGHLTPFDQLIRFCGQLGRKGQNGQPYRYYFQRKNEDSTTFDYDQIPRNQQIYAYLAEAGKRDLPGYGASFASKYGNDEHLQILTEIFDYIRCTNLHDDSLYEDRWTQAFQPANINNNPTYTNPRRTGTGNARSHKGFGQVAPIEINYKGVDTMGFGRFFTVQDAAVVGIFCAGGGFSAYEVSSGGEHGGPFSPGIREHAELVLERGDWRVEPSKEPEYSNFPPLPPNVKMEKNDDGTWKMDNWPVWLQELSQKFTSGDESQYERDFKAAFNPRFWNWQLAYLDPQYRAAAPKGKYDRTQVTDAEVTRLKRGERLIQAGFIFNLFSPSLGWAGIHSDYEVEVDFQGLSSGDPDGMIFPASDGGTAMAGRFLARPDGSKVERAIWSPGGRQEEFSLSGTYSDGTFGGVVPHTVFLTDRTLQRKLTGGGPLNPAGRRAPMDRLFDECPSTNQYAYVTLPFKIAGNTPNELRMEMKEGKAVIKIWINGKTSENSRPRQDSQGKTLDADGRTLVQEIEMRFPGFRAPAPTLVSGGNGRVVKDSYGNYVPQGGSIGRPYWSLGFDGSHLDQTDKGRLSRASWIRGEDTVQGVGIRHGDVRLAAAQKHILLQDNPADDLYQPHFSYGEQKFAHGLMSNSFGGRFTGADNYTANKKNAGLERSNRDLLPGVSYGASWPARLYHDLSKEVQQYGDFDNGMGIVMDGPYINKPDEGNVRRLYITGAVGQTMLPYFYDSTLQEPASPSYFSPNRILPSPGMFGSLPTGVKSGKPWQTLLFRPNVQGSGFPSHPGAASPPDHLWLDLFWMPVVEPYAISEPLSTAGKVNLNYQILPFKHITRNTALHGIFKSEYMLCIPKAHGSDYKVGNGYGIGYDPYKNPYGGTLQGRSLRSVIHEDLTLEQFQSRFDKGTIFKSATEICDIHLIPESISERTSGTMPIGTYTPKNLKQMTSGKYWKDHPLVGDNGRERPYTHIYPRVTTKSNTFKVHYQAQVLQKAKTTDADTWDPDYDQVVADYRGSSIIERYIDPNDPAIPDYAADPEDSTLPPLDQFYRFRVVNPKRFAP